MTLQHQQPDEWNPLGTLIAALQANDPDLNGLASAPSTDTQAQQMHHQQAVPHPHNQQTLNALLQQPNILSILSLLPQPPLPDPNAAPVMTRSGRPSRPPQFDEQLLQLQQAAWAGLDPSFFTAINQQNSEAALGLGGGFGGDGMNAMLSSNGADALVGESGGGGVSGGVGGGGEDASQLDWWWPIQEEGEDEDPSYFPPSTNTPSGHLAAPNYVFSPSNFPDDAALTFASAPLAPSHAHANGSHFLDHSNLHQNHGESSTGHQVVFDGSYSTNQNHFQESGNESAAPTTNGRGGAGAKRVPKRSRKGKEKELVDGEGGVDETDGGSATVDENGGKRTRIGTVEGSVPPSGGEEGGRRVPMTPAQALARRKERNKLTAQQSRINAKNHLNNVEGENRQLKEELAKAKEEIRCLKLKIPLLSPPPRETPNIYDPSFAISGSTPPIHPFADLPPTPQPKSKDASSSSTQTSKPKPKRNSKPKPKPTPIEKPALTPSKAPAVVKKEVQHGKTVPSDNNYKGVHGWEMVDPSSEGEEEESAVETNPEESDSDSDYPAEPAAQVRRRQQEREALAAQRRSTRAAKRGREGVAAAPKRGSGAESADGGGSVSGTTGTRSQSRSVVPEKQQQPVVAGGLVDTAPDPAVLAVVEIPPSDAVEEAESSGSGSEEDEEEDDRSDDEEEEEEPVDEDDEEDLYLPIRDVPVPSPPPGFAVAPAPPTPAAAGGSGEGGMGSENAPGLIELASAAGAAGGPANKEVVDLLKALLTKMGGSV